MICALVGNQNCGKTTIFNEMTNMNQHVGNFPGVTVESKIGIVEKHNDIQVIDLPGLYSLNTYTTEERVSKEYIINQKPDVLINVIDSMNLERNLYLTIQLKKIGIPIVIALNMLDELYKNNMKINIIELSKRLDIPIVPITNVNKKEINELINKTIELSFSKKEKNKVVNDQYEEEIIYRYKNIEKICSGIIQGKKENLSSIDKILTNKYFGIPIFLTIMFIIFYLTFNVIGEYFSNLLNIGLDVVTEEIENILINNNVNQLIQSLIIEGIITGIGSVLSFLPIIVTLYFYLSILEDSGYMTRIAFIMDKPLSKIGLSGKSIVPVLLGFGCSVPAILSIRTIKSEKEKKLTMMLIPFISCSAKIPIYAIFVSMFFHNYSAEVMILLYIIGITIGITITGIVNKICNIKNNNTFIMELPKYRIPTLKNTWMLMWNKSKEFLEKTFSIIFITSIVIWILKTFDFSLTETTIENSILAQLGKKISPIFNPLGFYDWRIVTSLIVGISAKESIISTLNILTNQTIASSLQSIFNISSAISFLIFVLLYTPCIATIAIIKKEFGNKTAIKIVIFQILIAYIISFVTYQLITCFLNFF